MLLVSWFAGGSLSGNTSLYISGNISGCISGGATLSRAPTGLESPREFTAARFASGG